MAIMEPLTLEWEVAGYSPTAAVAWQNNALTRPVSLLEHDSILIGLYALCDFVAAPEKTGAPSVRGTILRNPYATSMWNGTLFPGQAAPPVMPFGLQFAMVPEQEIPLVGLYPEPTENSRKMWWQALRALAWRISDLCTFESQVGTPVAYPDARPVMIVGEEAVESVVTTVMNQQIKEAPESVRFVQPIVAAATAFAESQAFAALRVGHAATAAELAAISAATVNAQTLAAETVKLKKRSFVRAGITGAVIIGGSLVLNALSD